MGKIKIDVCLGSTCYVKGGAILQELNTIVSSKYADKVEVSGSPCFGMCSIKWEASQAPYVKVDGEIIEEATVEKVLAKIKKKLN